MTFDLAGGGAAIPGCWSAQGSAASARICARLSTRQGDRHRVSLLERLNGAAIWPARDQGHRGTCNAFAVTAAEELAQALATGQPIQPLSEEALYTEMCAVPMAGLTVPPTPDQIARFAEQGATFLEQAQRTLTANGLAFAGSGRYDLDPLLPVNHRKRVADLPQAGRQVPAPRGYVHDIAESPDLSQPVNWAKDVLPADMTLGQLFHQALSDNRPVVIALPLFEVPGRDLVSSAHARRFGRIGYPPSRITRGLRPVGGHSLCLVGYEPRPGGAELSGWFVFRNSFGPHAFAAEIDRDPAQPRAPAAGYGLIAAADVERWCWEYLFRA